MSEAAHDVLWRRMRYMLTPQWDVYISLPEYLEGKSVLEVGFGTGAGVLQYADHAYKVDAIEVDPGAVDFAKKCFPHRNVEWMQEDIVTYQTHKSYMACVMIETLEHVTEWKQALQNIYDHLVPGGRLFMSARNANADLRRYKELHEREWTAPEFKRSLLEVFDSVTLYDYTLVNEVDENTGITPVMAIATKEYKK